MTVPRRDPVRGRHTRPSALGSRGWLLPILVLLPAVLVTALAIPRIDRLYRGDAGVVRARQLIPYGVLFRYGGFASPEGEAALLAAERRWEAAARPLAKDAAVASWVEDDGHVFVVLAALSDDPAGFGKALRAHATQAEEVRAWPEGDRAALVLVAVRGNQHDNVAALIAEREELVRSSVQMQRAASLTAGAVLPVVALLVAFVAVSVAFLLCLYLVYAPIFFAVRRLRDVLRRNRAGRWPPVDPDVGLAPGVEVAELDKQWVGLSPNFILLPALPLAMVALPAATVSLWPGSSLWAAVIMFAMLLAMKWARGSRGARLIRPLLYLFLGAGISHALVGWPARLPTDAQMLVGLTGVGLCVGLLALLRKRRLPSQEVGPGIGVGPLGARWLLLWGGFVVMASSSAALFLGSNGETDVRAHLADKAIALLGLVAVAIFARRVRGARSLAVYERLRHQGRPEVLFLRSFIDDRLRVRSDWRARPGLERWLPWPSERFEDVLLRGFEQVGPLVAIGKPGTDQTELGASRELVIGEDWLTAVRAAMDRARLITVVLGLGEGLNTELLTLRERGCLDRVCIVVPPLRSAEAAARLANGTLTLGGGEAWGRISVDAIDARRQIVALVGIGPRRLVLVARRRARGSTYAALAAWVSAELHSQLGALYTQQGRVAEAVPYSLRAIGTIARFASLAAHEGRIDIYWLCRQREILGNTAFRAVLGEHVPADEIPKLIDLLDSAAPDGSLPYHPGSQHRRARR